MRTNRILLRIAIIAFVVFLQTRECLALGRWIVGGSYFKPSASASLRALSSGDSLELARLNYDMDQALFLTVSHIWQYDIHSGQGFRLEYQRYAFDAFAQGTATRDTIPRTSPRSSTVDFSGSFDLVDLSWITFGEAGHFAIGLRYGSHDLIALRANNQNEALELVREDLKLFGLGLGGGTSFPLGLAGVDAYLSGSLSGLGNSKSGLDRAQRISLVGEAGIQVAQSIGRGSGFGLRGGYRYELGAYSAPEVYKIRLDLSGWVLHGFVTF